MDLEKIKEELIKEKEEIEIILKQMD